PMPQYNLPVPAPGDTTGSPIETSSHVVRLPNGNVVVVDAAFNHHAGVVCLYSGATGTLISTLTGNAGDNVGSGGPGGLNGGAPAVTVLADGNFVVSSARWHGGAGAVTWGSGTTGVSGTVSAANSLVGSTPDLVGQ